MGYKLTVKETVNSVYEKFSMRNLRFSSHFTSAAG